MATPRSIPVNNDLGRIIAQITTAANNLAYLTIGPPPGAGPVGGGAGAAAGSFSTPSRLPLTTEMAVREAQDAAPAAAAAVRTISGSTVNTRERANSTATVTGMGGGARRTHRRNRRAAKKSHRRRA